MGPCTAYPWLAQLGLLRHDKRGLFSIMKEGDEVFYYVRLFINQIILTNSSIRDTLNENLGDFNCQDGFPIQLKI
jgi:hypothetical protein